MEKKVITVKIARGGILMKKTALVVGATGLVGKELVKILLEAPEYDKVVTWVRRPTGLSSTKLDEQIIDFDNIENYVLDFKVDHVFCCLGTTIKKAKTKTAFKKVDLDYPLALGRWAKKKEVPQFLVISSIGANSNSKIFYSSVKGQLEEGLKGTGLNALKIIRPSLLIGQRDEFRLGERSAEVLFKIFPFVFSGQLSKYKPVQGKDVAYTMYKEALKEGKGSFTISSDQIGNA